MSSTISFLAGSYIDGDRALLANGTAGCQSDTQLLQKAAIGFVPTAAGTIKVGDGRGGYATFTVVAGSVYPVRVAQVYDTGTSLTNAQIQLLYGPVSP